MARYAGRVIVHKVDKSGKKIKSLKAWLAKHPKETYFDSFVEWEVWDYMERAGIDYVFHPTSIELLPAITTKEFKRPKRTKKAIKEGRVNPEIKTVTQRGMEYTPDYYLPDFETYIEVKGFADEQFKMRWKLFKAKGYDGYIVYSLAEFKLLYKQLEHGIC
jgi:hypothetical protein